MYGSINLIDKKDSDFDEYAMRFIFYTFFQIWFSTINARSFMRNSILQKSENGKTVLTAGK